MNMDDHGDGHSCSAVLAGDEEIGGENEGETTCLAGQQKKRKRWKTLLDNLVRGKRKSIKVRQVLKESVFNDSTEAHEGHHVLMIMESLYQAEKHMSTHGRNTTSSDHDYGEGRGVECILDHTEQQPTKKMKFRRFNSCDLPSTISEEDDESTIPELQSLGSCSTHGVANGALRVTHNDPGSVLSVWSVLHRTDMVALFQDIDEEEVELMLIDEEGGDLAMDEPWMLTPEESLSILNSFADLDDPLDDEFDSLTVVSCSDVSSLSANSSYSIPFTFAYRYRDTPTVNPWAAAKRGDMKALQSIAARHDPSIWMTEDAFNATPLYYACRTEGHSGGPAVVLFLLEQWPTGCVPSHILESCRQNAIDNDILRILNGDQEIIKNVRNRAHGADSTSLPLLHGEGEI